MILVGSQRQSQVLIPPYVSVPNHPEMKGVTESHYQGETVTAGILLTGGVLLAAYRFWRNWQAKIPTVYGIYHDESAEENEYTLKILRTAHDQGIKSVGLELRESLLGNAAGSNIFLDIAKEARKLGMKVVPLETNEGYQRRCVVNESKWIVGAEGGFSLEKWEKLREKNRDAAEKLRNHIRQVFSGAAPEVVRPHVINLKRHQSMVALLDEIKIYLESINFDLDRYASSWGEENVVNIGNEITDALHTHRPRICFVGKAHLDSIPRDLGYRLMGRLEDERICAEEWEVVRPHLIAWNSSGVPRQLWKNACRLEPKLPQLAFRAFFEIDIRCASLLRPDRDIEFLKMSVSEAGRRMEEALRRAV